MTINILIRQAGEEWGYCGHRGTVAEAEALAQEWRAAGYQTRLLPEGVCQAERKAHDLLLKLTGLDKRASRPDEP